MPMSVLMIRAKVEAGMIAELEQAATAMFTAIESSQPERLAHRATRR